MTKRIALAITSLLFASSLAFAGNFTVATTPEQDAAVQQATRAKRGSFAGKTDAQLVQLMFDRGVKGYQMFLLRTGKIAASEAPVALPDAK